MRIGVDARVLMDKNYSGISQYAYYLLQEMLLIDNNNHYVFYYNSWRNLDDRFLTWNNPRISFKRTKWPNKFFNYFLQKIFSWPKIDLLCGDIDVFWSPHLNFSSFASNKIKKVITIHDLSFLRHRQFFSWRQNIWHHALRVKKQVHAYDLIIAISENTKQDLIDLLDVPAEKIIVVYSGLNKDELIVSEDEQSLIRKKLNLQHDFILYLGNIEPRKNVQGLIEAYSLFRDRNLELSNCQLVLAGAKAWKNKAIYRRARKSLYRDDIIFLGYVSKQEKKFLYQQAKIFVYPSYYEGFGFPPLEAMASGLPVITSDASSLPEVVGDAAITVNPYCAYDLAKAMEILLQDESLRSHYAVQGKNRSLMFNWQKTASSYLEIFKNI